MEFTCQNWRPLLWKKRDTKDLETHFGKSGRRLWASRLNLFFLYSFMFTNCHCLIILLQTDKGQTNDALNLQ
jgi:hypothetical protein